MFGPTCGAVLADLGADVLKVEPPEGDPFRSIHTLALSVTNLSDDGQHPFSETSPLVHIVNRGKRSITLDLSSPTGREVLLDLARDCDVFLTSYLPAVRSKLKIDVDDIRAVNPTIIYARASGWGPKGPQRNDKGFDLVSAYATSGLAYQMSLQSGEPEPMPPGFFDVPSGTLLAGAIGTALYRREKTGEPSVVDVSLLNTAWWQMCPSIVAGPYTQSDDPLKGMRRRSPGNALVNAYPTADGRWLYLCLIQPDRDWPELCRTLDAEFLMDDPRFVDIDARASNVVECVAALDEAFRKRTAAEWSERFADFTGAWSIAVTPAEVHQHVQAAPNGYLPEVTGANGVTFRLVAPPMEFDETIVPPRGPAPEIGQHTEEILLEHGFDWDKISELRQSGALG